MANRDLSSSVYYNIFRVQSKCGKDPAVSIQVKAIYLKFVLLAMLGTTTACTILGSSIPERAEAAFRRQNQLSSEFMLAAPEVETNKPARYESLLLKEEQMLDACQPLNTLATKRRDNKSVSFEEKKSILGSLDACERATDDFDTSLQNALHRTPAPGVGA